jgi:hypothetical protein
MARIGRSLEELGQEIERIANSKRDYMAPASKLAVAVVDKSPTLVIDNNTALNLNRVAFEQMSAYLDVPLAYSRRMAEKAPELFANNYNRWLSDKADAGDRRMIRALDGGARAVLSPSYRRIEVEDLFAAVYPILRELDLMLISAEITEQRLYLKAVDRSIQMDIPTGKFMGDGGHTIFDTVSPAITISTSEVGRGNLMVESGVWTRACTNLATFGAAMKRRHVGSKIQSSLDSVEELLSDRTKELENAALMSKVRDVVRGAFNEAQFEATTRKLAGAAQDQIKPEQVVEVVERAGKRFSFSEIERKSVVAKLIGGGDLTRYGLHSAITLASQDLAIDYDRATELESIGGEVIELSTRDWREIVKEPVAA